MDSNKKFLSGTLKTIVLALLRDNGRMYGYEICQKTKEATNNQINLTEGAIYPTLHRLEKEGLIYNGGKSRGDLYIKFDIQFPKFISSESKKILKSIF